jgi:hypothetical protein
MTLPLDDTQEGPVTRRQQGKGEVALLDSQTATYTPILLQSFATDLRDELRAEAIRLRRFMRRVARSVVPQERAPITAAKIAADNL